MAKLKKTVSANKPGLKSGKASSGNKKPVKKVSSRPVANDKLLNKKLLTATQEIADLKKELKELSLKIKEKNKEHRQLAINSGSQMKMIMDNTEQAFILIDKSLNIIALNRIAQVDSKKLFGRHFKINDHILDYSSPERLAFLKKLYKDVFQGNVKSYKHKFINSLGEDVFMQLNYTPIKNSSGKATAVILNAHDITNEENALKKIDTEKRNNEALINNTIDLIWSVSSNFKLIAANKPFVDNLELASGVRLKPGDDLVTKYFPKDFLTYWKGLYSRAMKGERFIEQIYTPQFKKQPASWSEITFNPIFDGAEIAGVACYGRNVTERKKIEQERKRILDSISDCFYAIDNHFNFTYMNSAAEKFMFVDPNELIGKNLWEYYPALKYGRLHENIVNVLNSQEPLHFEFYHEPDKNWFEESIYPTEDGVSVFFKSINDRKKIETTLNDTLKEKDSILESFGDGFIALDSKWTITYWNNKAQELTGMEREVVLNKNYWDVFRNFVSDNFYNNCMNAMLEKENVHFLEYFSEVDQWHEISAFPSEIGLSIYFKDITARIDSEKQLSELNEELKKRADELLTSNTELEQFAYVASHDLQEPLRMVSSFLQLLQKKYQDVIDETGNKYIHFAVDGADRMKRLINDLLQYSRVGRDVVEIADVDMNDVMLDVSMLYQNATQNNNAQITWKNLPVIKAEKTSMIQLMQNLVGNALKYKSDKKPVVSIESSETNEHWLFKVKDNGIGIDPRFAEKIFVIFQRLHNKDEYSGTGIGLAICKKIVERYKGKIWVESEKGEGSTFCFTISKL